MVSSLKFFYLSGAVLLAGGILVGCGASVPEATDEEVIALLGDSLALSPEEKSPLVIKTYAVECAGALSGLNADVTKDMPKEALGDIKTKCRQAFDEKLKDNARNTKGFKLEHFESKDFAKRIATLAEVSKKNYDDFEEKRREEEEKRRAEEQAQRIEQAEQELAAKREEFERSLVGYEDLADEFVALCDELSVAISALRAREEAADTSSPLEHCAKSKEDILKTAEDNRAKWAEVKVEVRAVSGAYYAVPDIDENGFGTTTGLNALIASLKDDLVNFKRRLGQIN